MTLDESFTATEYALAQSIVDADTWDAETAALHGEAWLDEHVHRWLDFIVPETFDIASCHECVLGQTLGSYGMSGTPSQDQCEALGFDAPAETPNQYRALQNAWLDVFKRRGLRIRPDMYRSA